MSSILPHKDCHPHITSCIVQSNKNMQAASEQAGSHYVNNDLTFYTLSGQLKTGWLRDSIHPNTRGSSGLAVSIKRHFSATLAGRNMTPPPTDQTLCAGKTQIPLLTNRSFHPPSRPSRRNQTPYNPSPPNRQPLFSHPRPTQSPSKTRTGQTTLGPPDTRRPLYSEVVAKRYQPTNHRQDDAAGTLLTTPPYDPPGVRGSPDTVTSRRHQAVLDLLAKLLL